jgi:hypothetical protein
MMYDTQPQDFWSSVRRKWGLSIIVGLAVLLIRYNALIPLVWQMLVQNGTIHDIGTALGDLLPFAAIAAGCILLEYAIMVGFSRTKQALELNSSTANALGGEPNSASSVVLRTIGRMSLLVNAPILYWAVFLFVLLPQLVKIPNYSLRIGTTSALAGAFFAIAVIVVLAAHIGLALTRYSFKSIAKTPELPALPVGAVALRNPPSPYVHQSAYAHLEGHPLNPLTAGTNNPPYPDIQQRSYLASTPQAKEMTNDLDNPTPQEAGSTADNIPHIL